mmetsp:Transcript_41187/g.101659  ORF Transcript_41187/g.101659 Transcript_41187/m.101659 type:complete len:372 (+) Transcript_41187:160-1275(+)|eukprot:CAMPEP_0179931800 /NCGR_PEP_ID=MMETSP0983-20121128/10877_1 /TAXON_ID=483367 /ORGANISM="non described non described, Strain CCMP 2436" /LENGTH=371 /DNA_ID=CAMNT_0021836261 /DNA_START=152 /DNA_END=1267 /DNA_ORIENTATION=+
MSSNVYPWQALAHSVGGTLRVVARPMDGDWTRAVIEQLSPRVAVVALPHVHWTDGGLVDLSKVSRACADVRAALVVDATQSLGALSFSLSDIRADFVMASTHKWLLGPYGCCPLYCSEEWQRRGQPLEFHEHARAGATSGRDIPFVLPHQAGSGFRGDARAGFGGDAQAGFGMRSFGGGPLVDEEFMNDDVAQLMRRGVASGRGANGGEGQGGEFKSMPYDEEFAPGAIRFDSGGRPNPILLPMVAEGLRQILEWTPEAIHAHSQALCARLNAWARHEGFSLPRQTNHFTGLRRPTNSAEASSAPAEHQWAEQTAWALKAQGVLVAGRFGALRVAPHVYNSDADIDALVSALQLADCLAEAGVAVTRLSRL